MPRARQQVRKEARDPTTIGRLEEQVAVLTEQEQLLVQEKNQLLAKADTSEAQESIKHSIDQKEGTLKRIAQAIETLQVELEAPARITLLQRAEAPKSK